MKFNVKQEIIRLSGEPYLVDEKSGSKFLVKDAFSKALVFETPQDKLSREEKWKRYGLYKKVIKSEDLVDLTNEDVTVIKDQSSKLFSIDVFGAICEILDNPISDKIQ